MVDGFYICMYVCITDTFMGLCRGGGSDKVSCYTQSGSILPWVTFFCVDLPCEFKLNLMLVEYTY